MPSGVVCSNGERMSLLVYFMYFLWGPQKSQVKEALGSSLFLTLRSFFKSSIRYTVYGFADVDSIYGISYLILGDKELRI